MPSGRHGTLWPATRGRAGRVGTGLGFGLPLLAFCLGLAFGPAAGPGFGLDVAGTEAGFDVGAAVDFVLGAADSCPEHALSANATAPATSVAVPPSRVRRDRRIAPV
jgi:hypothetical protein